MQASLVKLYLSWDRVQSSGTLDAYTRRIMVNENNSLWRRGWRRREFTVGEVPEPSGTWDRHDHGEKSAIWSFVQTLPKKQRAVIVLRFYEELSVAEVAEILGLLEASLADFAAEAGLPRS